MCKKLIKNSQPFGKKIQKTTGGIFFDSHCMCDSSVPGLTDFRLIQFLSWTCLNTSQPADVTLINAQARSCFLDITEQYSKQSTRGRQSIVACSCRLDYHSTCCVQVACIPVHCIACRQTQIICTQQYRSIYTFPFLF